VTGVQTCALPIYLRVAQDARSLRDGDRGPVLEGRGVEGMIGRDALVRCGGGRTTRRGAWALCGDGAVRCVAVARSERAQAGERLLRSEEHTSELQSRE